ncbi:AraC family transcriptional regulator [Rubeoparvulum massiliense]|uniref:AraC family transcriptional regulator n=1 Tax=Rubeoparvulum massiliense TaxID=1631346 RepID=UPI00065E0F10|nr:AraC family transcriptional regulator [Rubeoparvulum massiliense]
MNDKQIIAKAIVFIENNLCQPIVARDVAEAVSYSYYHFHRYFQAIMGETIGNYIRSRRLTQAAWDLVHSDKKVLDVGLSLYFETAESFTRAFKDRYSMTPSEYRKNGIDVLIGNRQSAQKSDMSIITYAGLSPEILVIPEIYLMGIRFKTTVSGNKTVTMWQQFNKKVPPDLLTTKRYGIFETSETCSFDKFNTDSESMAFVGIEISKNDPVLNDLQVKKLCGGKYARFVHRGTVDTLIQTYHYIWGSWFPKSGFELANRDDFECYTERFTGANDSNSEIDIYFPIE